MPAPARPPKSCFRAVFDFPDRVAFQRMDDSFASYGASINLSDKTIVLTNNGDKSAKANFSFQDLLLTPVTSDQEKIPPSPLST